MPDLSATPPATQSLHRTFLEQSSPAWLINATPERRTALKAAPAALPDFYRQASASQRKTVRACFTQRFAAQTALDKAMSTLQDIDTFAAPLLAKALKDTYKVELDLNTTLLCLNKPIEVGILAIEISRFEVSRLPLLQAALHSFEARECEAGAFHHSSGFLVPGATPGHFETLATPLTVTQFIRLCRTLDVGAKYQRYLKNYLQPAEPGAEQALRDTFISAQKAALAAAAEQALLSNDIEPADYRLMQSVIEGSLNPKVNGKPVWFRDLGLMNKRMTGCLAFVICEKFRYSDDVILYIPNDPQHPLKRFTWAQLTATFKQRFTARDATAPDDGSPTAYQRFFSQFVAYSDRPAYFSQFTEDAPARSFGEALLPHVSLLTELAQGFNPFRVFTDIKELPPGPPPVREANPDPFLAPTALTRAGHGIWAANVDLWHYLFEQHRDKMIGDARSHAVPTADVDARVRSEKLARLLNIGMLVLNTVSMFVPVLGEVMMGVMAGQLLYETLEGSLEWSEGDRQAAKVHLVDVAENLALLGAMAAGGKVAGKLLAAKPEPVIEALAPVTLPGGQGRLWKPAFDGYESPDVLLADAAPNAAGQYHQAGKTYIRQSGKVYEKTYDESLQRWRIKHPADPDAYQPPLTHNGAGAWRLTHEQPSSWNRVTLLRRMGPVTDGFTDDQLLAIADIAGAGDHTLRKMHLDNQPPPPEVADALRLFSVERDVAQVIEQVSSGRAVDGRYLYVLPLVTELPRWPAGRTLRVFDGPGLSGRSQTYGVERINNALKQRPTIRISRADVLNGQLPSHILAALDESEVVDLLGSEPARVRDNRALEFSKQLADYARTRQPAIFDSLYTGTRRTPPRVAKLQRLYPGLSESAAHTLLDETDTEQLIRLHDTGRVPLEMQERARWYVRQGRVGHAFAGLHMENLTSADSKRLALHTLGHLPGWSGQLRLEVREGSIDGALLDSIGSETAAQRKYLVKKGPRYQAFNARGEALNSLTQHGDSFYDSIMHALPDDARQALGMPQVSQSLALRRAIIDYAVEHRQASAQIVEGHVRGQPWFKPPQRISPRLIGYPASGRGEGMMASLASRVRAVYPQLTEDEANGFILRRMTAGDDESQIYNLLNNRMREWQTLESTLDQWAGAPSAELMQGFFAAMGGKRQVVQAIKACWRRSPLAERARFAELEIFTDEPLPALTADFSHVRTLTLSGRGITNATVEQVLGYFPQIETLRLVANTPDLSAVPAALEHMPHLTNLSIASNFPLEQMQVMRLGNLTGLRELSLECALTSGQVLDVSRLSQLRRLKLGRAFQWRFPTGVFQLPLLERLDFSSSSISTLPPEMFQPGRERLWSGLTMNWSHISREQFLPAFAYVTRHAEHLLDLEQMVRSYCEGELSRLQWQGHDELSYMGLMEQRQALFEAFKAQVSGFQARFNAMEALSTEYAELNRTLDDWSHTLDTSGEGMRRSNLRFTLRACWYNGLLKRFGTAQRSSKLVVRALAVSELPELAPEGFAHVETLQLIGARVPPAQLARFIQNFANVRTLDLSNCALVESPLAPGALPSLAHLNLADNPIIALDVSAMPGLQALNLSRTKLQSWPIGAQNLTQLSWLDLRDSQLTHVPQVALDRDGLVIASNLTGAPLDPATQSAFAAAQQRVEDAYGLAHGALGRFALEDVPDAFPPIETGMTVIQRLLPLPSDAAGRALSVEQRLQRLNPALQPDALHAWAQHLQADGATELSIHLRVLEWERSSQTLTRELNDWMFIREAHGHGWRVSSQTRRWAAQRILESWRSSLLPGEAVQRALVLEGVQVGDLPGLPTGFTHVESLNLKGVRLTEDGSNGFLHAFPQLRTLMLNGNLLVEVPEAVSRMEHLQRLELSTNPLIDPARLYRALATMPQLRWLDLSHCNLETFDMQAFPHLQTLDIASNRLTDWPAGVLQHAALNRLNLSLNEIDVIPPLALEGGHDALMFGTDLSGNMQLPREALERLQDYAERTERTHALGFSRRELRQMLEQLDSPTSSEDEDAPAEPDEVLEPVQATPAERDPWFETLESETLQEHRGLWDQLEAEPDSAAFFNLLKMLQDTKEFRVARADLTRRVWRVLKAAGADTELRQTLFGISNTHGTCVDGRILTFSGLEVKVYEHDTLFGIDPSRLDLKGPALLKLSRQLFRLGQVEALASAEIARRAHPDEAEIRLEYRVGLQSRLDLPAQPAHMNYGMPLPRQQLEAAVQSVLAAESTQAFFHELVARGYWVDYLQQKYPETFAQWQRSRDSRLDALESAHPQFDQDYTNALNALYSQVEEERYQTLLDLSQREVVAQAGDQPGPSRAEVQPLG
ncbi:NEL-type E3 ubiquitin ligase domain-containing protein [Pseudomonas sp. EA_65y_Pfl1_P113]|uniref:NEL-type E3 ubiquitin ligase domain-containing protein n=1 Tax=Pseudomonas sp. EA_65y_Pfl1_P113 TaxID=3088692 RepID=UPI0030DD1B3B